MTIRSGMDSLLRRPVSRLPRWAAIVVALACVVGGVVLIFRPFTSVEVLVVLAAVNAVLTGALMLTAAEGRRSRSELLVGLGWIVLGIVLFTRLGIGVDALAVIVGVALLVNGAIDVLQGLTGRAEERVAELLGDATSIVFGVLALSWPDLTVFVVAVLFGARTAWFGLSQLFSLLVQWRRPTAAAPAAAPRRRGWFRRGVRVGTRLVALGLALLLLVISVAVRGKSTAVPKFYDWNAAVPSTPGKLLRSERVGGSIPSDAQGWRILYSTKTSLGEPSVGSALVMAPKNLPSGPRPMILWDHGTVGIARACAPSLFKDLTNGVPAVPEVLQHGWVMVARLRRHGDEGADAVPGGNWGGARGARRSQRGPAAHRTVASNETVVWGHSQGGGAALWTGHLAPKYAPS